MTKLNFLQGRKFQRETKLYAIRQLSRTIYDANESVISLAKKMP